jgi:hypothetical protein
MDANASKHKNAGSKCSRPPLEEKAHIACCFLNNKVAEYEALKPGIEEIQKELESTE